MSIGEFTAALKDKSNQAFQASAKALLDSFALNQTTAFNAKGIRQAGSIISEGKYTRIVNGKQREINLTEEFRFQGEQMGNTRLITTVDDFNTLFKQLNISTQGSAMELYFKFLVSEFPKLKANHFEIYLKDGSTIQYTKKQKILLGDLAPEGETPTINPRSIIAIRGLTFSHASTLDHMAHFLEFIGAFPGKNKKDISSIITGKFHRGHVYAQTTGRAIVSLGALASEDNILAKIVYLYKLLDETQSSLYANSAYSALLANVNKDFYSDKPTMNIQFQVIRDEGGLGNSDTGDISNIIRIVKFLQNLIDNTTLSRDGKRLLSTPAAAQLKAFEKALVEYDKKLEKNQEKINRVLASSADPEFLVNLRGSDSLAEFAVYQIGNTAVGKKTKSIKSRSPNAQIISSKTKLAGSANKVLPKVKPLVDSLKKSIKENISLLKQQKSVKASRVSNTPSTALNLTNLQNLLNQRLHDQIKANMGTGQSRSTLNYRSGRLAQSAQVERMSESRAGMITAFYTYMKYPYATFSDGGAQQSPKSRDPKLLIAKSIREIAGTSVANRMRAVNI